jgi:hypothetical protein
MNFSNLKFTIISSLFLIISLFAINPPVNAQVDPSAYANGVRVIVEINSKGEIKALKMAPPRFKTQLHRISAQLSVQNDKLKMVPMAWPDDTLIYIYIRQPYTIPANIARALKISNPNEAKLRKGMITINNRRKVIDLPTSSPLKLAGKK